MQSVSIQVYLSDRCSNVVLPYDFIYFTLSGMITNDTDLLQLQHQARIVFSKSKQHLANALSFVLIDMISNLVVSFVTSMFKVCAFEDIFVYRTEESIGN